MPQMPLFHDQLQEGDVLSVFTPEDRFLTRGEIAARLGVSKHKNLIALIEQCVERGTLQRATDRLINGAPVFLYQRV